MNLGSGAVRTKAIWLLLPPFFVLARPRPLLLLAGGALAVAGALLRAWAAGCIRKDRELTTGGPYAHTRHPLYLGSLLLGIGVTVAGGRPTFTALFLVFFFVVYGRTMRREEERLAGAFGDAYRHYRERVPRLLPRPTPYRRPAPVAAGVRGRGSGDGGFSGSRYLRNREWEAALGLVAGFGVLIGKMLWPG